ncbi:MAG: hypothetical protein M3Z92_11075 [Bacteroidota bacterium]|nr:hypothetical protein [Bacteroidota bacterium]
MRKGYLLCLLVLANAASTAQSLKRPVAGSYIGLGAYSLDHVDAFSFTSNQASLAQIKNMAIGVYGERRFLLAETNMYSAVIALPTKQGNFGFQADYFGFKNYNESQIGIAYARSLGSKLDIGVKFNYYSLRIPGYQNSSAVNFELGAIAHLTDKLHAGIHFYNPIGGTLSKTDNEKLGSIYKFGVGYEASENFLVSAEIVKQEDLPVNVTAGVQYNFAKQFFARVGIASENESPYAGAGISWNDIRLDISAAYHSQLGFSPGLMLIINFKSKEIEKN